MASLGDIEKLTQEYSETTKTLSTVVKELQVKVHLVKRGYLEKISELAKEAAEKRVLLNDAILESSGLFVKPRTLVISGVKVGFQKKKGKIIIINTAATVKRIKEKLADKADVLLKTDEKVVKAGLNNLSAGDLKKIGVEITADADEVLIKSSDDDIEKFVDALIDEEVKYQEQAEAVGR